MLSVSFASGMAAAPRGNREHDTDSRQTLCDNRIKLRDLSESSSGINHSELSEPSDKCSRGGPRASVYVSFVSGILHGVLHPSRTGARVRVPHPSHSLPRVGGCGEKDCRCLSVQTVTAVTTRNTNRQ
jgi:hypothetical protein